MEADNASSSITSCLSSDDNFADLIRREVIRKLQHSKQEKKQYLVLKKYIPTFSEEIRCMMYTHGDVQEPLSESVLLMGTVLRDQMNMLLEKATESGPVQKGKALTHEHILPLLVPCKRKLKRLLFYLKMRDVKEHLFKKVQPITDLIDGVEYGKKIKACLEFLLKMDENFDTAAIMDNSVTDPVIVKRQQRRYVTTYHMSEPQYLEFSRKLQASFYPKGGMKLFMKWLLTDYVTHLIPSELALEIINFLAYETVAEIVDLCLWLKYNRNASDLETATDTKTVVNNEAVDNDNTGSASSDIETADPDETVKGLQQSSSVKEGCSSASNIRINHDKNEPYLNDEFMGPMEDTIMLNIDPQNISTDINIKLISETFGDEFKEGIIKTPITPANIGEAINLASGIHEYQYNVHWKRAKRPSLLCIEDNDTVSLPL